MVTAQPLQTPMADKVAETTTNVILPQSRACWCTAARACWCTAAATLNDCHTPGFKDACLRTRPPLCWASNQHMPCCALLGRNISPSNHSLYLEKPTAPTASCLKRELTAATSTNTGGLIITRSPLPKATVSAADPLGNQVGSRAWGRRRYRVVEPLATQSVTARGPKAALRSILTTCRLILQLAYVAQQGQQATTTSCWPSIARGCWPGKLDADGPLSMRCLAPCWALC